ncbi:DDB1- and CUL4-associated factor 12 homolog isoform X2 [Hyalella azteca]|uniref:DDB1- and CUL4-associated factor 12 homolog isoform X2 n=1 Tax=Hyalella azteca TaxID=294128 RepID=A0A8B7P0B5_HYAAZ|nr:DDB1- and CUL4-associated factor 12 homolog isoform X2 [Hyalella azteca]
MALVTTLRCRVRGRLPARFVQKRKAKSNCFNRQRVGHFPIMLMEPEPKIDDFMLYSEPDEDEEEELDAQAMAAAAAAEHAAEAASRISSDIEEEDEASDDTERDDSVDVPPAPRRNQRLPAVLERGAASTAPPKPFRQRCLPVSYNVADYTLTRSLSLSRHESLHVSAEYSTRHMLTSGMFRELPVSLIPPPPQPQQPNADPTAARRNSIVDKVFCSQWLSSSKIIMGTKCNRIKVYDSKTCSILDIPRLCPPVPELSPTVNPHGVYAIEINPSRTLLATVTQGGRNVAVYRLPDLAPFYYGHKSHTDGILDLCWLDDNFLVSGGMDRRMALWRIDDYDHRTVFLDSLDDDRPELEVPPLQAIAPLRIKKCFGADKVRGIIFNQRNNEIVALSTNAYLHIWSPERFYQKMSRKLPHAMENVCLTQMKDSSLYAVGSKSHFTLLDPRTLHYVKKVSARINGCSVKSLSFHHDILTVGTAVGAILFYDMRAGKYMESTMNSGRAVMLKCSRGFVHLEEAAMEMPNIDYSPTVYTHCYDQSGTRLFAAGGPLSVTVRGHYAAIWR